MAQQRTTLRSAPAAARPRRNARAEPVADAPLVSLARQVRGWADTLLHVAGSATDMGLALAQTRLKSPVTRGAVAKAGQQLRQWREAAGLTLDEVSEAVGLGDSQLIAQAEGGLVSLPFDMVLRLAGVLGRRDPLPIAMALTRQYNPQLWKTLEELGIGKLVVQGSRERELANVYRGSDAARALDDAQFARVLAFTRQAFDMAVALHVPAAKAGGRGRTQAGEGSAATRPDEADAPAPTGTGASHASPATRPNRSRARTTTGR